MTRSRSHPLDRLLRSARLNILGLNSGTSLDGLDLCLLRLTDSGDAIRGTDVLHVSSVRFPKRLRDTLWGLASETTAEKQHVLRTQMEYTRWVAQCVNTFRSELPARTPIHAVAFHGQTIAHYSRTTRRSNGRWHGDTTWQLGSGPLLAHLTGIVTVNDFRSGDIAAGGMGAPLSGYYHHLLFGAEHAVLNLGGIANISVARERRRQLEVLAFDVGPANMIIDLVAQRTLRRPYDRGGQAARKGTPIPAILKRAAGHPYFRRKPPKSCGREEFGDVTLRTWFGARTPGTQATSDWLATAVEITASQIACAIRRWIEPFSPVRSLLLCGGGVRNRALVDAIRSHLNDWSVDDTASIGVDPQYVEPAGFAVLANETLRGRPGNLGGATGASPAILSTISLPYTS